MVCWATSVSWAPGVENAAVNVAAIPGVEVRNEGIVACGGVGVSLGAGVSVIVSVAVGSGVAEASKAVEAAGWATLVGAEGCACENTPHAIVIKTNKPSKYLRESTVGLLSDNSNHNTQIKLTRE